MFTSLLVVGDGGLVAGHRGRDGHGDVTVGGALVAGGVGLVAAEVRRDDPQERDGGQRDERVQVREAVLDRPRRRGDGGEPRSRVGSLGQVPDGSEVEIARSRVDGGGEGAALVVGDGPVRYARRCRPNDPG